MIKALFLAGVLSLAACACEPVFATDTDGFSETLTPKQREIIKNLHRAGAFPGAKSACCDDSEGRAVVVRPTVLGGSSGYDALWINPIDKTDFEWIPVDSDSLVEDADDLPPMVRAWWGNGVSWKHQPSGIFYRHWIRCLVVNS